MTHRLALCVARRHLREDTVRSVKCHLLVDESLVAVGAERVGQGVENLVGGVGAGLNKTVSLAGSAVSFVTGGVASARRREGVTGTQS